MCECAASDSVTPRVVLSFSAMASSSSRQEKYPEVQVLEQLMQDGTFDELRQKVTSVAPSFPGYFPSFPNLKMPQNIGCVSCGVFGWGMDGWNGTDLLHAPALRPWNRDYLSFLTSCTNPDCQGAAREGELIYSFLTAPLAPPTPEQRDPPKSCLTHPCLLPATLLNQDELKQFAKRRVKEELKRGVRLLT